LLAFVLAAFDASAGQVAIRPIGLSLDTARPVGMFTVVNPGSSETVVQVTAHSWSQSGNRDQLVPTRDLIVTPPIFTIPAGESQVVRVGIRAAPGESVERAYRLQFTEVPPPPRPGFNGLSISLNVSVPVFLEPSTEPAADLEWVLQARGRNLLVEATNHGNAHFKVAELAVLDSGSLVASIDTLGYILPGSTRVFELEAAAGFEAAPELIIEAGSGGNTQRFPAITR